MRRVIEVLPFFAPLGRSHKKHSFRAVAVAESCAIRVPVPMTSEMMGNASVETTLRSKVKMLWRPSPAAWEVLRRFPQTKVFQPLWLLCPTCSLSDPKIYSPGTWL